MEQIEWIVFKLCCYYHAKTELYDRTLTYERSRHDPTEAYLDDPAAISYSNKNALKIREQITNFAENVLGMQRSDFRKIFREQSMCGYSAQGWIDLYNHLMENGEMKFLNDKYNPKCVLKGEVENVC